MKSAAVVKSQTPSDQSVSLRCRVVCSEKNVVVFGPSLEPLDKDVVTSQAVAITVRHRTVDPVADIRHECAILSLLRSSVSPPALLSARQESNRKFPPTLI
jgi:hypothetical protein